jgi:hypothetical protein
MEQNLCPLNNDTQTYYGYCVDVIERELLKWISAHS